MKRTIKLIMLALMLAAFTAPVLAQSKDCTDDNKRAWYQTFLDNRKGEAPQQKTAAEAAQNYLNCGDDPNDAIAQYLKKWLGEYNRLTGAQAINKQFEDAFKAKNYPDQMRLGKQILATDADNPAVTIVLGLAGLGDPGVLNESAQYARKAVSLIESGKSPAPYTRDQALAYLNWTIGKATLANSPADAIPILLKAAKYDSEVNKKFQLYLDLAAAYENGPRAKLTDEYKSKIAPDGTETDASKLVLENLNQVIDRQIDAMARAAALATDATAKKAIVDDLTVLYKFRNKSETGLNDLIANVLNKPLPEVPSPISSLPSAGPASTSGAAGTNGGSTSGTTQGNSTTTAKPAASNSVTSTGTQKPATATKPAPTPSPTPKGRPRANFRRG